MKQISRQVVQILLLAALLAGCRTQLPPGTPEPLASFDGERSLALVDAQVALGPRVPGEPGHNAFLEWVVPRFEAVGWEAVVHQAVLNDYPIRNVIAQRGEVEEDEEWVVLAAHYDTRRFADRDPDPGNRTLPVPGANDGASGVALLLEIARVLPDLQGKEIWIVLFDQEDGGDINGQPWIIGSSAFVRDLPGIVPGRTPDAVVVVDMIGDADLNIHIERSSDPELVSEIWNSAERLGYGDRILSSAKYSMIDDHRPFLQNGIPAVLMIDFDYPFWHTAADTPDKVSAESLKVVGDTLLDWLAQSESP